MHGNIASEAARIIRLPEHRGRARDPAGYIRESIVDLNAYIVPVRRTARRMARA